MKATAAPFIPFDLQANNENNQNVGNEDLICSVCKKDILFHAVGVCNHRNLCSLCAARRRILHQDYSCTQCEVNLAQRSLYSEQPLRQVILLPRNKKTLQFHEISSFPLICGDNSAKIFFRRGEDFLFG
jgi:hypothetical protein